MASLFSQNIGLNYKGIINLGSTINSPLSGTLQAITDGDGVASPLQLSTTQVAVGRASRIGQGLGWGDPLSGNFATLFLYDNSDGYTKINNQGFGINLQTAGVTRWTVTPAGDFAGGTTSASARLHVRGDGTNPSFRSENSAATQGFIHSVVGDINNLFLGRFADTNVAGNIFYDNSSGLFTIRNNYAPAPNFGFIDLVHGNTTARIQNGTNLFALRDSNKEEKEIR